MAKQKSKKTVFQKQAKIFKEDWEFILSCHQKNDFSFDNSVTFGHYEPLGFLDYFNIPEEDCCLQKAQHIMAKITGYKDWNALNATEGTERELAEAMLQYCLTIENLESWLSYREYSGSYEELSTEKKLSKFYMFMDNDNINFAEFDDFNYD